MVQHSATGLPIADMLTDRRAHALVQHQRVIDEAAQIARVAAQARRRAEATPMFPSPTAADDVRERVNWMQAS